MADFRDIAKCTKKAHKDFESCNILSVDIATTGSRGGDSGHGGRTFFQLKDKSSTDIDFRISKDKWGCKGVEIMLGGDTELETFIDALRWAADELEKMA